MYFASPTPEPRLPWRPEQVQTDKAQKTCSGGGLVGGPQRRRGWNWEEKRVGLLRKAIQPLGKVNLKRHEAMSLDQTSKVQSTSKSTLGAALLRCRSIGRPSSVSRQSGLRPPTVKGDGDAQRAADETVRYWTWCCILGSPRF